MCEIGAYFRENGIKVMAPLLTSLDKKDPFHEKGNDNKKPKTETEANFLKEVAHLDPTTDFSYFANVKPEISASRRLINQISYLAWRLNHIFCSVPNVSPKQTAI
ncbi:MAG: hypothetical protein LBG52_06030 [Candidatus Peribacteria bacterium]|jgi:hypothetical protein|nr:hypothetical protein [Candidatus Peribacteria bacterium]